MLIDGEIDLYGIRVALGIEAKPDHAWHLFNIDKDPIGSEADAELIFAELAQYNGPHSMPADLRHIRILVDAAAIMNNARSRSAGWALVDIPANWGRAHLSGKRPLPWATFHALYCFGVGVSRYDPEDLEFLDRR